MADNEKLNFDELESAAGGNYGGPNPPEAYCKQCGHKLIHDGQTRIGGGNTGIYHCDNVNCTEYGLFKNNLQVLWK